MIGYSGTHAHHEGFCGRLCVYGGPRASRWRVRGACGARQLAQCDHLRAVEKQWPVRRSCAAAWRRAARRAGDRAVLHGAWPGSVLALAARGVLNRRAELVFFACRGAASDLASDALAAWYISKESMALRIGHGVKIVSSNLATGPKFDSRRGDQVIFRCPVNGF